MQTKSDDFLLALRAFVDEVNAKTPQRPEPWFFAFLSRLKRMIRLKIAPRFRQWTFAGLFRRDASE